jgi:hypothetical protein
MDRLTDAEIDETLARVEAWQYHSDCRPHVREALLALVEEVRGYRSGAIVPEGIAADMRALIDCHAGYGSCSQCAFYPNIILASDRSHPGRGEAEAGGGPEVQGGDA